MSLLKGLGITFRYIFRKPITVQYPEERAVIPLRFRGRLVMPIDPEKGANRCTACMMLREDLSQPLHRDREGNGPGRRAEAEAREVPVQPRALHVLQPLRGGLPFFALVMSRRHELATTEKGGLVHGPRRGETRADREEGARGGRTKFRAAGEE